MEDYISLKARQTIKHFESTWFTSENPTLLKGEIGYEDDTGKFKIGDGTSNWVNLSYAIYGLSNENSTGFVKINGEVESDNLVVFDNNDVKDGGFSTAQLFDDLNVDAVNSRTIDGLYKIMEGITHEFIVDDSKAYQKTLPTNTKVSSINAIHGQSGVWEYLYKTEMNENVRNYLTWQAYPQYYYENGYIHLKRPESRTLNNAGIRLKDTPITLQHKYYLAVDAKEDYDDNGTYGLVFTIGNQSARWEKTDSLNMHDYKRYAAIIKPTASAASLFGENSQIVIRTTTAQDMADSTISDFYIKEVFVDDLTARFGEGHEPLLDDVPSAYAALGIDVTKQQDYISKSIIDGAVNTIVINNNKNNTQKVINIPQEVLQLEGYGWSCMTASNYIYRKDDRWCYRQEVARKKMADMAWSKDSNDRRFYTVTLRTGTNKIKPQPSASVAGTLMAANYKTGTYDNVKRNDLYIGVYTESSVAISNSEAYDDTSPITKLKQLLGDDLLYYELDEPREQDITDLMPTLDFITFGDEIITFKQVNGTVFPVKSEVQSIVSLAE